MFVEWAAAPYEKRLTFGDLKPGEQFIYNDSVYLKIQYSVIDKNSVNCTRLDNGRTFFMDNYEIVKRVEKDAEK